MASNLIVTIDGPAGVGKSTMAKRLAETLAIPYLDTGAMFRGVAYSLGEGSWEWDEERVGEALQKVSFTLAGAGGESRVCLNGKPLGDEIRTEEVGMWASNVATLPIVRSFLKQAQSALGESNSLVAEGRDMGTVVFPAAPCKFFLDASVEERAIRRYNQLLEMGREADLAELQRQIAARDDQDRNRAVAPLKAADDAIVLDTSDMDIEEVFAEMVSKVRGKSR